MKPDLCFFNQKGVGLIESLISIGLMGLVFSITTVTIMQQKIIQQRVTVNQIVESEIALVRLNILGNNGLDKALTSSKKTPVLDCLKGSGSQCLALTGAQHPTQINNTTLNSFVHYPTLECSRGDEPGCLFQKRTTYSLSCEADHRCHQIEFLIELIPLSNAFGPLAPRSFSVPITDRFAQGRSQIDFSCAEQGLVSGSNYDLLRGECFSVASAQRFLSSETSAQAYSVPEDFEPATLQYEFEGNLRTVETTFCENQGNTCHTSNSFIEVSCSGGFEVAMIGGPKKNYIHSSSCFGQDEL